jgi:peptidoglycan/xylan/chitin deacetylase (PgdA/CDA1 family)
VTRVALTFDTEFPGRPTVAGVEERILAALAAADARATFFLQGRWVRVNPELARKIAEAGHLVANHSHFHAPMDGLTDELLRRDVHRAEETIRAATGADPRPWFRCPFGDGMDDDRVLATLRELEYRHVGWDVDPLDWEEGRTADAVRQDVLDGVAGHGDGAIVLLHGWPQATAEMLPGLLEELLAGGAELVSVDELGRV